MSQSNIQDAFMREVAETFRATKSRIMRRLAEAPSEGGRIVEDELRGLYHGLFVIFDGGTPLADEGLVRIIDADGKPFDRFLHEICFRFWPSETPAT